ncbi:Mini-chromosome maintenance complex-binding protein [Actinidia chinensis var. chinensis]|uniref:Mini-chromosome maintenance complex-binding protein n=1 Tax=Actinidia chinensis var. chinensis TaxID=1590841 RepID=A0A2R6RTF1_ACTCC|nr:Mini-chromosome maintenance complex-binding protein [Actinidia chinensis var. chinensis]
MVGLPYDYLVNPLGAVRLTFEKAVASRTDPATFNGRDWGAADLFRDFLFDNGGLSQVPILNATNVGWIQPNTLVRYRGMIQDMLGNEFYVGAYKDGATWRTNKFTDVSQFPMNLSSDMRVWERRLLYCVPVPGQNPWTESSSEVVLHPCENLESPPREKRQREDDAAIDGMDTQGPDHDFEGSPCMKKMADGTSPSTNGGLGFDRNSLPCLVKVYDSPEDDLKLNDVFEFVGVLIFDAEIRDDKDDSDEFTSSFCEDELTHLPPRKVPRLHCLIHRKLAVHDFLSTSLTLEPKSSLVKEIRQTLLGHLTAVLGNDGVAAHLMLLHLLSRVHTRVDTLAVGKLSLNLAGFNNESVSIFGNSLNLAIKNLLPFTHGILLTVDYLNAASLAPRKDYQTNRLVSGVLQLAEGSHMTIDATQLQAGTLNAVGVENSRLLKNLMELQKVEYDFKYYKMEMAADVQLLILSEGKSNILPADLVIPFHPSSVGSYEVVDTDTLKAWRWYLSTLRTLPHSIEPEMQKVVEDDLVAARQADRSLGGQEFSKWLTMGRLMSVSFGETCLSLEHWQMVKELERLRRERLK